MANADHLTILQQGVATWNQWRTQNATIKPDLSTATLSGLSLSKVNLHKADLRNTDLSHADLGEANLGGANLCGAICNETTFRQANLRGAQLDDSTKLANKWRIVWRIINQGAAGHDLSDIDLSDAYLMGADFESAILRRADLRNTNLHSADLRKADLRGANLSGAILTLAILNGSQVDSSTHLAHKWRLVWEIVNGGAKGRDLSNVDLSGARLQGVDFQGAKLRGADLRGADLRSAKLTNSEWRTARIDETTKFDAPPYRHHRKDGGNRQGEGELDDVRAGPVAGSKRSAGAKPVPEGSSGSWEKSQQPRSAVPPTIIDRYPNVSLRSRVAIGQTCTLRVSVTQESSALERLKQVLRLLLPADATSVVVGVLVTAEDCEILGDDYRQLIVPLESDSDPLLFELTPRSVGEKRVKVEFFQADRYVGGVTVQTDVVSPAQTAATASNPASVQGVINLVTAAAAPDLTILITESQADSERQRYTFKLHSPANDLYYYTIREQLSFTGSPSRWLEALYQELSRLPNETLATDLLETLNTIGANLYEQLFPRELKEIWEQRIRQRVETIMIISDEPWIPWEMIKPFYTDSLGEVFEDNFLCQDYALTRWLAGSPPPTIIKVTRGALIAPTERNLPSVTHELEFLHQLGSFTDIEPSLAQVRQLLTSGGYQLLHFACHGSFDPTASENSLIYLQAGDKLQPRDITGKRRNFGKNTPLIFINACHTARADFSLVGIGSWADKFINAKASCFVGSAWEVNDELAYHFAKAFYSALQQGQPLGEAMRTARRAIQNEPDPTWLAYTLYADPLAKVVFV